MEANLALPAGLIGDPVRAAILSTLWDGQAQPAGALACAIEVLACVDGDRTVGGSDLVRVAL